MTHEGKPSPTRRREDNADQDVSYEEAQVAYDAAWNTYNSLLHSDEYQAVCNELEMAQEKVREVFDRYEQMWARINRACDIAEDARVVFARAALKRRNALVA